MTQTILHLIEQHQLGKQIALKAPGRKPLTYAGLVENLRQFSGILGSFGLKRDQTVALVLPNGPEMASAFLGIASACIAAPLNPGYRQEEFEFYFRDLQTQAVVLPAGIDSPARQAAYASQVEVIELESDDSLPAGQNRLKSVAYQQTADLAYPSPDDIALVLHTSGTTSRPKIVPLTHANLWHSARQIAQSLHLGPSDCCLNIMPLFHIHGLVGCLLSSLSAGGSIYCTKGFSATRFFDWLEDCQPTWYSAVPSMHQAILNRRKVSQVLHPLPDLRFIRSSSAALPQKVKFEIESTFATDVVEAYGMTEASHQIAITPFFRGTQKPGSVGLASGTEIAILSPGSEDLLPTHQIGEIAIKSAGLTRGYLRNPEANRKAFTRDGWFRTGDQGYLDEDGFLFITGRLKEIINRGGEKIMPGEVDQVLLDHPGVEQAVTFAIPDLVLGEEIAAAVVRSDDTLTEKELRHYTLGRLADFKVPRRILFLDQIPKGPTGKLQRIGLAEQLGLTGNLETLEDAPREPGSNPLEMRIAEIWQDILEIPSIGIHQVFFDLGGDSISAAQIAQRIGEEFNIPISLVDFFEASTIEKQANWVRDHTSLKTQNNPRQDSTNQDSKMAWFEEVPQQSQNEIQGIAPLAPIQRGMWFLQQMQPESNAYHIGILLSFNGHLNRDALQYALDEIIRRNETLRTSYPVQDGNPIQRVHIFRPVTLLEFDLSTVAENEQDAHADEIYRNNQHAFNLLEETPIRFLLLRFAPESHRLIIIVHHINFDGGSIDLMVAEFVELYRQCLTPGSQPLSEPILNYRQFAARYENWLGSKSARQQQAYWEKVFHSEPAILALPADRHNRKSLAPPGDAHMLHLSRRLTGKLKAMCGQQNVTPFMLMLAAYKVLLHRYTHETDLTIGAPVSIRQTREQQNAIGLYINTLALRSNISGNPPFSKYLQQVRHVCLQAYGNRDLPFDQLVQKTSSPRSVETPPLFQVMFQLRKAGIPVYNLGGVQIDLSVLPYPTAKFDLTLDVRDYGDTLVCTFNYNASLFNPQRIREMAARYQTLLESILADPSQAVNQLSVLDAAETHKIVHSWNETNSPYPVNQSLPYLFQETAERFYSATAILGERHFTYAQLEEVSNQVGWFLLRHNVQPGDRVAVFTHSSAEMVACLLGILKTGAAYVPVDPSYPQERIERMLEDCRPRLLLSHSKWADRIAKGKLPVFLLDRDWMEILREDAGSLQIEISPETPAYVIYTSGSSGAPKGVVVPHRAITRLVRNTNYISIHPEETIAQASNLSFDAATFEIWGALLNGARLALIKRETLLSPATLEQALREKQVNVMFLTTALFNTYAEKHPAVFAGLRCLLFGGEESNPVRIRSLLESGFPGQLLHVYGPTENTTFSTWYRVEEVSEHATHIPIGRPISNSQAYILSPELDPLPPGFPGELYLGGDGLAQGYLNQPEFTAERFIPDPFHLNTGAKLYRTGDICEYLPDGNIIFLGRSDEQIKIRGFRVELGEIRNALLQHPAVADALVLLMRDENGEKFLAAYLTPIQYRIEFEQILAFLQNSLPQYMIPAAFTWLEEIPISPNGKVDRSRLPSPQNQYDRQPAVIPGLSPLQKKLVAIWKRVLDRDHVGIHENFFDLGGHSILIVQLCIEIEETLGISLTFSQVFDAPTITGLEYLIERGAAQTASEPNPLAVHGAEQKSFFWIGSGFWQFQKHLHVLTPARLPEQGEDGFPASAASVKELATLHAGAILSLQAEGPYYLGGFSFGGMVAYETARQLLEKGQPVELLFLIEPTLPWLTLEGKRNESRNEPDDAFARLLSRLSRHASNLASLPPGKRLNYLGFWVKTQIQNRFTVRLVGQLSRLFHRKGKAIPIGWRRYYIKDINDRLAPAYQPLPYPGKLIQVQRDAYEELIARGQLPANKTEVIKIKNCLHHEDLMKEPFVDEWMDRLHRAVSHQP